mgnify:FL=1
MKKSNVFLKISILINVLMIFFGAYIGNLYVLQGIALFFAVLSVDFKNIKIKPDTMTWIVLCMVIVMSVSYSINKQSSMEVASLISMAIILKLLYENQSKDWNQYFLTSILLASSVHVIATMIQLIFPDAINLINSFLLSSEGIKTNQELFKAGGYAGITAQTSVNAFYIAIFVGGIFLNLILKKKHKIVNTFLLIISIIALFITGKRGMLFFSLLAISLIYLYIAIKDRKNIFKYIVMILIVGTIGYISVINIPQTKVIIDKIQILSEKEDALNGRDKLWQDSIEVFINNPLMGIGIGTIQEIIGEYSHNSYIQILAETGIVGELIYILAIVSSVLMTIKKASIILKGKDLIQKNSIVMSLFMQGIFIMYGFTGNPLYGQYFIVPYVIAIAMSNSILVKEECKVENRNYYLS